MSPPSCRRRRRLARARDGGYIAVISVDPGAGHVRHLRVHGRRRQLVLRRAEDPARGRRRRARRRHVHARQPRRRPRPRPRSRPPRRTATPTRRRPGAGAGPPEQAAVTITQTVDNTFGQLLGARHETITRTSVANYQAPLPMGSPCNEFGNGPEPTHSARSIRAAATAPRPGSTGPTSAARRRTKSERRRLPGRQLCGPAASTTARARNSDYSTERLLLQRQAHRAGHEPDDPGVRRRPSSASATSARPTSAAGRARRSCAKNQYNYNAGTSAATSAPTGGPALYASGQTSSRTAPATALPGTDRRRTPRTRSAQPVATSNPWDPTSYPVVGELREDVQGLQRRPLHRAERVQAGQHGDVVHEWRADARDSRRPATTPTSHRSSGSGSTLCTFPGTVPAGTYFIQVQSNAAGDNPSGNGHNRFALRAFGVERVATTRTSRSPATPTWRSTRTCTSAHDVVLPDPGLSRPRPARCSTCGCSTSATRPSPARSRSPPPADSNLSVVHRLRGDRSDEPARSRHCSIAANSSYNGKWEQISIPIPTTTRATRPSVTGCWITLAYDYGSGPALRHDVVDGEPRRHAGPHHRVSSSSSRRASSVDAELELGRGRRVGDRRRPLRAGDRDDDRRLRQLPGQRDALRADTQFVGDLGERGMLGGELPWHRSDHRAGSTAGRPARARSHTSISGRLLRNAGENWFCTLTSASPSTSCAPRI